MTAPSKPRRRAASEAPYHWFQGASVRELYDRLSAAGPDTARVEVRVEGTSMLLRVVTGSDVLDDKTNRPTDINDSRRCPPIC